MGVKTRVDLEYVDGRTGGEKGGRDFYHLLGCPISAQPLLLELPTRYLFLVGVIPHYKVFVLAGVAFSGRGDIFMCCPDGGLFRGKNKKACEAGSYSVALPEPFNVQPRNRCHPSSSTDDIVMAEVCHEWQSPQRA